MDISIIYCNPGDIVEKFGYWKCCAYFAAERLLCFFNGQQDIAPSKFPVTMSRQVSVLWPN